MAVKNPQFEINVRMNENSSSSAFGKYYPKAVEIRQVLPQGCGEADHLTARSLQAHVGAQLHLWA